MKVIDLVNKIYNNEIRDNTKIKFINEPSATIWEYKANFNTLSCGIMNKDLLMCLDAEIEIIEEIKKEVSFEDMMKIYKDSRVEVILRQFHYEHNLLRKYLNAWEELSNMLKSGYPPIYFTMQELEQKHGIEVE